MQAACDCGVQTLHPWQYNNVGVSLGARRDTTQVMLGVSLRARCDTTLVILMRWEQFRPAGVRRPMPVTFAGFRQPVMQARRKVFAIGAAN